MPRCDFPAQNQRYIDYRFCPCCGRPYQPSDFHADTCLYVCASCGFDFYQNPAPAAVVVIAHPVRSREVLLLKRSTPPNIGRWCVPGGFVSYGESPSSAAAREALEEVGLTVQIGQLLNAGLVDYTYRGRQLCVVEIGFLGHIAAADARRSALTDEASEIAFVPVDDVLSAPAMLAFPEQLALMHAYRRILDAR